MKTVIIGLICLIVGGVLGGFAALGFGVGAGAASGLIMGSQVGVCLAVEAAKQQGLLSTEGANRVVAETVAQIRRKARNVPADTKIKWIRSEADCSAMIRELPKGTPQPQHP
jgi:hypothetical protein